MIGPPDHACFALSSRVRSGETIDQVRPPSALRKSTLAAWYTTPLSWRETRIGAVHWKRYLMSPMPWPEPFSGHAETLRACLVSRS